MKKRGYFMHRSCVIVLSSSPSTEVLLAAWVLQKFCKEEYEGMENTRYVFVKPDSDDIELKEEWKGITYITLKGDVEYIAPSLARRLLRGVKITPDTYLVKMFRYFNRVRGVSVSEDDVFRYLRVVPKPLSHLLRLSFLVFDRLYHEQSLEEVKELLSGSEAIRLSFINRLMRTRECCENTSLWNQFYRAAMRQQEGKEEESS